MSITIVAKEKHTPSSYWDAEVEEEDVCRMCKKPFKKGEEIYVCEVCKKGMHKECIVNEFGRLNVRMFCDHYLDRYDQYKCEVTKCQKETQ